jgi:hypothetical protein
MARERDMERLRGTEGGWRKAGFTSGQAVHLRRIGCATQALRNSRQQVRWKLGWSHTLDS